MTAVPPTMPERKTSQLALWGLILGILSFFLWLLAAIPGLILSIIGIVKTSKPELNLGGKGMAISGLVTSIVGAFIAGPIVIGMIAAITMPAISSTQGKAFDAVNMSSMKQLTIACRVYSSDNEGNFPPNLETLEPDYVDDLDEFGYRESRSGEAEPFLYFPGLKDSDSLDQMLIAAPKERNGKRIVAYVDGRVIAIPEAEFQAITNK